VGDKTGGNIVAVTFDVQRSKVCSTRVLMEAADQTFVCGTIVFFSVPLEMGCASKQKGSVFQKELKSSEVNTQNQARTKTTNQVFHDPGREV
jgi:hypothetical protein